VFSKDLTGKPALERRESEEIVLISSEYEGREPVAETAHTIV
jgi:hypothetical protein